MLTTKSIFIEGYLIQKDTEILTESDTENIKVKNEGVLEIPEGKSFSDMPISHFISLAKKLGKGEVSRAINNIARWNENKSPETSKKAKSLMDSLKNNKEWEDIPAKSE